VLFVRIGAYKAGKILSSNARHLAMYGKEDPKSPFKIGGKPKKPVAWFLASTLSRGLNITSRPKDEIERERVEAVERLTTRLPMPEESTLKRLGEFIDGLFKNRKEPKIPAQLPVPAAKSCLERAARRGGALVALELYGQEAMIDRLLREQEVLNTTAQELEREEEEYHKETLRLELLEPSEVQRPCYYLEKHHITQEARRINYAKIMQIQDMLRYETSQLADTFRNAMKDTQARKAKVLPILGSDGKIRMATIHSE